MGRRAPTLAELPPPPPGKVGWPWTEGGAPLPDTMPGGAPWPLLSIVTPSFQQAQFLEETIRSVLLQGYPNLEYIVVDGGSRDGSVEIIERYSAWIASWVSEKDRGQSHAINKGMARANGSIVAWINSDDPYLPNAFSRAVAAIEAEPECAAVYSDGLWIDEAGATIKVQTSATLDARALLTRFDYGIPQPTVFMRRDAWRAVEGLDESLHMAMDFDLWVRLALRSRLRHIPGPPLAALRFHSSQKTQTRVAEDRLATIAVIERALRDPRCPPGVSLRGNAAYARCCLDLAEVSLREKKDLRAALGAFARAVAARPRETLSHAAMRQAVGIYRAIVPPAVQTRVRRVRGTETPR